MNLFNQTIKYLFKNGFRLLPFAIVPAVALAFSGSISTFIKFFLHFNENVTSLWGIYSNFSIIGGRSWPLGVLAIISTILFLSMLYGGLERHMKVGRYSFVKAVTKINETIMAVLPTYLIVFVSLELVAFLNSVLILLFNLMFPIGAIFPSIISTLLIYAGITIFFVQITFVIPSAILVGYSIKDSILYSMRIVQGRGREIFLSIGAIVLGALIISTLINIFTPNYLSYIVDIILYIYILLFVSSFSMVAYYSVTNEPRRDLERERRNYLT